MGLTSKILPLRGRGKLPCAKRCPPLLTVPTPPISDIEGKYDAITFVEQCDPISGFDYDAHVLVAKY